MHLANVHEIGRQWRGQESDTTWHVLTPVTLHPAQVNLHLILLRVLATNALYCILFKHSTNPLKSSMLDKDHVNRNIFFLSSWFHVS